MSAIKRRHLLQLASLAGLSVVAPAGVKRLRAQESRYAGPMWFFVHAGGGWDPTMLCDPKGTPAINRTYTVEQIGRAGNIAYAPIVYGEGANAYSNQKFFEKFGPRLCVINGVETMTNNHDTGTVHTWSGRLGDGNPALGALIAGVVAPNKPLAFVSGGGFDKTEGLTSVTRVDNIDVLSRIAYPNRNDPAKEDDRFHSADTAARIAQFQRERLDAAAQAQTLPALGGVMGQLLLSRTGSNELDLLMQHAPSQEEIRNAPNNLLRQAMIAIAGYQAGISVCVSASVGGFDTHGNHDANQANALGNLLTGLDLLIDYATQKIGDNFVVVVGSDFGRTPVYNQQNGKDHWSATSMMVLGKGVRGDRVIGATDERQLSVGVDPSSLAPTNERNAPKITPGVVHRALRQLAGVDQDEKARYYPVSGDEMALSFS
jgi:uncharacterized protein DUF1501